MAFDWSKVNQPTNQSSTPTPQGRASVPPPPKFLSGAMNFLAGLGPLQAVRLGGQIGNLVGGATRRFTGVAPSIPVPRATPSQVLGDIGTLGLTLGSGGLVKAGGALAGGLGRIGASALTGAGFAASGAAGENQPVTARTVGTGALVGGALGAAGEGVSRLLSKYAARAPQPQIPVQPSEGQASANKLTAALKGMRLELSTKAAEQTAGRAEQLSAFEAAGRGKTGVEAARAQLGAMRGPIAPEHPIEALQSQISKADIDSLYTAVQQSSSLRGFDKPTAYSALNKVIYEGKLPNNTELSILEKQFGKEFAQTVASKISTLKKLTNTAGTVLGVPRSILSSFDLSAPFRQGWFFLSHPKQFFRAFPDMIRAIKPEEAIKVQQQIDALPARPLMEGRVNFTVPGTLGPQEESFLSANLTEKLTGGKLGPVAASNRAYSTFLNKLRADMFQYYVDLAQKQGALKLGADGSVVNGTKLLDDIGKLVNVGTGRGSLGQLGRASNALSTALFSPRLLASRLQVLNPQFYATLDPFVRKEAIKSVLTMAAGVTSVLSLARLAGAEVEGDPHSSDFGKIKIGDTRYDILAGHQQIIKTVAQLLPDALGGGYTKSSISGKITKLGAGYKPLTRADVALRFLQSKEAPVVSFVHDLLNGQDYLGRPLKIGKELYNRLVPMAIQDTTDAIKEWGAAQGVAMTLPGYLGIGTQTYGPTGTIDKKEYSFTGKLARDYQKEIKAANTKALTMAKLSPKYKKGTEDERAQIYQTYYTRLTQPITRKYVRMASGSANSPLTELLNRYR